MRNFKLLILIILLNSFTSFGQAVLNGSTLTVTDLTGSYVYYEHNINLSGGLISSTGPGAPLNTPIRIKITSNGTTINPYFTTGDLNGNCDTFLVGSMNSTNTQFTTTLNSCCSPIAEGFANGYHFGIPIKCATVIEETSCITYNLSSCSSACIPSSNNLYCISFFLPSNSATCRTKNYTVVLNFSDGTSTTIIVNFASNNTVFCFTKPINTILSSTFSTCKCGVSPLQKQISSSDKTIVKENNKIIVSPNPTNSIIKFTGENLEKYNFSLFDSNGKIILSNSKINTEISIDKQSKGIYIYVIEDENGFKQEGKIIKE